MGGGVAVEHRVACNGPGIDVAAHGRGSGEGDGVGKRFLDCHGSDGCDLVQCSMDWLKGHPLGEGPHSHAVDTRNQPGPRGLG
jgi:hypothetical protein